MQPNLGHVIGQSIKEARNERGLTQEQLAQAVDLTPRTIQYIEAGKSTPKYATLFAIATVLNTTPFALLDKAWDHWNS